MIKTNDGTSCRRDVTGWAVTGGSGANGLKNLLLTKDQFNKAFTSVINSILQV